MTRALPDAELEAWLRLKLTPGVGDASARKLLAAFGLPPAIFAQPRAALAAVVGPTLAERLLTEPEGWRELCEQTRRWLAGDKRRQLLTLGDPDYPAELLQIEDPPLLLHLEGDPAALRHPLRLAMVGSRNPTAQGADHARQFARALAEAGACIVSGLALGIDGAAHEGALEAGGCTVAVVGTGLDQIYPKKHQALAQRIAAQGALISEYLLGTPPLAPNFPKRNRIISGLSQGVLVVEAALQSGSLITARQAAEQGREVFAIPGSIHSPQSRGCHALIRQGAKLVESAADILEELRDQLPPAATGQEPESDGTAEPHDSAPGTAPVPDDPLLRVLGFEPCGLDALQARCGLDLPSLQARLLELEFDGWVARLPGGVYQRRARS
ncbi:DNA-processing protein DprA [Malikia spinosa]|uniref:DNA-processing protein DprA n=1 Tax=Malikia spinosa TaxID=86180 RepID=UPI00352A94A1